ncbi:MAG: tetratricopeptide repeat protein [Desulfobacterales bacterium]|nr:tetratricopeptide repeat protein [Desulfobacterales bacterium]
MKRNYSLIVILSSLIICLLLYQNDCCAKDWYEYGIASLKERRFDEAIKAFTKVIESKNDDSAIAQVHRAECRYYKGEYEKSIQDYTDALEKRPDFVLVFFNRGVIFFEMRQYMQAISDFTQYIDSEPRNSEAFFLRGVSHRYIGEFQKAVSDLNTAVDLRPGYTEAYNDLAWIMAACPDAEVRDGNKAIALAKLSAEKRLWSSTLDTLAAAYAETGQFEDAVKTQQKAIDLLKKENKTEQLAPMLKRLDFYNARKPWRLGIQEKTEEDRIADFLGTWRLAWLNTDLEAYLKCYDSNAKQGSLNGTKEIAANKKRLWADTRPKYISFGPYKFRKLEEIGGYEVVFDQIFTTDKGYEDTGVKALIIIQEEKSRLIAHEKWTPKR